MLVSEQHAIGDEARDRLGLVAALREAREAIVAHALPVLRGEARAHEHVGGEPERGLEALGGHLQRQLRAVAAAAEPEIGAELLEILGHLQRSARPRALVEHVGRRGAQARERVAVGVGARAEHDVHGHERRHLASDRDDLEAVREHEARGARRLEARQRAHGGRALHHGRRGDGRRAGRIGRAHASASASVAGAPPASGTVRMTSRRLASTAANASRTDAGVAAS